MLNITLNSFDVLPQQLQSLIADQQSQIDCLLKQCPKPSYQQLIPLLETLDNQLHLFWSPIEHLNAVKNNDDLREAYQQCLPLLSAYHTWMSHHQDLFHAFESISNSSEFPTLSEIKQKYITDQLRDFKLSGVHLSKKDKQKFSELSLQISELSNQYEQNLMDSSDAWQLLLPDAERLAGLPENILHLLAQQAVAAGETGYLLTLQAPCFIAISTYAHDQALRKSIYEAWVTRASAIAPSEQKFDNTDIMYQLLSLKHQYAQLLGFPNYSSYALETQMAKTPETVDHFLTQLIELAKPFAQRELAQLSIFAKTLGIDQIQAWDIAYVSEKLKEQQLHFDDEQLRSYFTLPVVLDGLFKITKQLFSLNYRSAPELPTWHQDVLAYAIENQQQETIAYFYLDLYAREKKRGGAWMDNAQAYWKNSAGELQKPIAFLNCNFLPPINDQPALLTHNDLITLFHEFGHGLHHMLSKVEVLNLTGTNVERDAVELPSQLLENWCWEADCLPYLSRHYQTNESLPHELIKNLLASKNFLSGLFLVRQLEFALFDLRLHWQFDPNQGIDQIQNQLDQVRHEVAVLPAPIFNRFQNSFAHIFSGGYSSAYYSYLWADVLAADAFSFFKDQGLLSKEAGDHFKQTLLSQGAAKPAAELFKNFRGREPKLEPLLKSYGLI